MLDQEWQKFQAEKEHWTESKRYKHVLINLRKERDGMAESKWKSTGDPYLSSSLSEFKRTLFDWFQCRDNDYKEDAVRYFFQEDYQKLRENFLIDFLIISTDSPETRQQISEFNLPEEEVVEQLAHYEAILKFISNLEADEKDILLKQKYSKTLESANLSAIIELPFPDNVSNLIKGGYDDEAAEQLSVYLKENKFSIDFLNDATQIQANLATAEKDFNKQKISIEQRSVQLSKARDAMLSLVKRAHEKHNL